jgi:hypothetical protein
MKTIILALTLILAATTLARVNLDANEEKSVTGRGSK